MTDAEVTTNILVMQRLGKKDLTGHCLQTNPNRYRQVCLPARQANNINPPELVKEYEKRGGLLSPRRLSDKILDEFLDTLKSQGFSGQFMQKPVAEEGNLVHLKWIREFEWQEAEVRANNFDQRIIWNFYIDGAYTEDTLNAPTGILVAAIIGGWLYVRHAERAWMELPALIKHIPSVCALHGYSSESYIFIEPKASGHSIAQMLDYNTPLNVQLDKPPKEGKVERMKACLPFIESGHLRLLKGAVWGDMYKGELTTFPFVEYKDLSDCTTMAIDHCQEGAIGGGEILDMAAI